MGSTSRHPRVGWAALASGLPPIAPRLAAALATGALYAASFGAKPGSVRGVLAFVAYVPLFVALDDLRSPRRALALGWAAGVIACGLGFAWLLTPLRVEGGLPLPAALALYAFFVAAQALRFVAHAGLALALRRLLGRAPSTAFVVAFVLSERFTPAFIPWNFAAALVDVPAALGVAPWLGPLGVALVAVACNASLLELVLCWHRRESTSPETASRWRQRASAPWRRALAYASLAALLASVASLVPLPGGAPGSAPLRVGVVQAPSVAGRGAVDPSEAWKRLLTLHRETWLHGATIVAMGEGALPFEPDAASLRAGEGAIYGAAFGVPTLVGAVVLGADEVARPGESRAGAERAPTNSVLAFAPAGLVGRYDKTALLPFSEYLPFEDRLPWLRALSPASGRFRPGLGALVVRLGGVTFSPSICFEDLFPEAMRKAAAAPDMGLLFNATNDGWFGDTSEPWVHLAHARLRAAEHARPLVRAATTGPSALIDERGRVVASAEPFRDAAFVGELRPRPGLPAPYTRWGDLGWVLALAAASLWRRAPALLEPECEASRSTS